MRDAFGSYFHQIENAARRNDLVSLNHRVAALLASYFDILFALNRQTHPGEKRLMKYARQLCPRLPANFEADLIALLTANPATIVAAANRLIDELEEILNQAN